MSIALLWVVSPNSEVSNCFGFSESARETNRLLDSSRFIGQDRNLICNSRLMKKGKKKRWNCSSLNADLGYSCSVGSGLENGSKFPVISSMAAHPAGEMVVSTEQKVYDVVLKQAALVNKQLRSRGDLDVKPDIVLPGTLSLLSEAYDRCGEVCAEYAKTFYLGTLLMTPERRRAIWAIYVWCRRTDELVDGPNASHISPSALDRWESRLEAFN